MASSAHFNSANPLGFYLQNIEDLPRWSWLYVEAMHVDLSLDTPCFPKAVDSRGMSEDEADEFESFADLSGLRPFLCRDQIEEITENLRQQCSTFTDAQLVSAIAFYWQRDAFIDLSSLAR